MRWGPQPRLGGALLRTCGARSGLPGARVEKQYYIINKGNSKALSERFSMLKKHNWNGLWWDLVCFRDQVNVDGPLAQTAKKP